MLLATGTSIALIYLAIAGGLQCSPLARAGTTITMPTQTARATGCAGSNLISPGCTSACFNVWDLPEEFGRPATRADCPVMLLMEGDCATVQETLLEFHLPDH